MIKETINFAVLIVFTLSIGIYFNLSQKNLNDSKECYMIAENKFKFMNSIMTDSVIKLMFQKQKEKCCTFALIDDKIEKTCLTK